MRRMYGQYVSMRDMAETTLQLVPGVRLESYQVYRYRGAWERAIGCSAALLEAQRQWTGTLVALKDLDVPVLFPDFDARLGKLGIFSIYEGCGTGRGSCCGTPGRWPRPLTKRLSRRSEARAAASCCRRRASSGVRPSLPGPCCPCPPPSCGAIPPPKASGRPEARRPQNGHPAPAVRLHEPDVRHLLGHGSLWILLDPPGLDTITFLELTILLGMIGIMTGEDKPSRRFSPLRAGLSLRGCSMFLVSAAHGDCAIFSAYGYFRLPDDLSFPSARTEFHQTGFHAPVDVHR